MPKDTRKRSLIQRVKLFQSWVKEAPQSDTLEVADTVATLDDSGIGEDGGGLVTWTDAVHGKSWKAPGLANNPGRGNMLNGHEVLSFDGATQLLKLSEMLIANLPAFSLSVLVNGNPSQGGNQFNAYNEDSSAGGFKGVGLYHVSTSDNDHIAAQFDMWDDAGANLGAQSGDVANDQVNGQWNLLQVVQTSKSERTVYIDGANGVSDTTVVGNFTLNESFIGSGFNGLVAFLHIKDGAYGADERGAVKSHVNSRYGLAFA